MLIRFVRACGVVLGLSLVGCLLLALSPRSALAAKVNLAPASFTLMEGTSQTVTITLDEPIISSDPDQNFVTLSFNAGTSGRLLITPSVTTVPAAEWAQPHTFIVTAVDDGLVNGDADISVAMTTGGGSEYYNGFARTIAVHVVDNDTAGVASAQLPRVGSGGNGALYALMASLSSGVVLLVFSRRIKVHNRG